MKLQTTPFGIFILRAARALIFLGLSAGIAAPVFVGFNLQAFEFPYIVALFGMPGLIFLTVLWLGGVYILWLLTRPSCGWITDFGTTTTQIRYTIAVSWALAALWAGQWLFMQTPFSQRLHLPYDDEAIVARLERQFSGDRAIPTPLTKFMTARGLRHLQIMSARSRLNRPAVFDTHPLWSTLERYSRRYNVDIRLLFFWLYTNSFWGEAHSGRIPFLRAMTGETFRDFVQAHLPTFFIESDWRQRIIETKLDFLKGALSAHVREKLTYAFQKASYDISMEPFETELYSDAFVVLREYKHEFPEIFGPAAATPLDLKLRDSFAALEHSAVARPCDRPFTVPRKRPAYYNAHRKQMIVFARALYYKVLLDFDFATKVQTLVARYLESRFKSALGPTIWSRTPRAQRLALMAMLTDIYMPNIGRLGPNLYTSVELQCTPLHYVINRATANIPALLDPVHIWRPGNYTVLWSGAGRRLRLFSELWAVFTGAPLPGYRPTDSVSAAKQIVWQALR